MELRRAEFENQWRQRHDSLESHKQVCVFDNDLTQINGNIDDLSRQMKDMKGQYAESLSSAKGCSQVFSKVEENLQVSEKYTNYFKFTYVEIRGIFYAYNGSL